MALSVSPVHGLDGFRASYLVFHPPDTHKRSQTPHHFFLVSLAVLSGRWGERERGLRKKRLDAGDRNVLVNVRLRSEAARRAGVERFICELQLGLASFVAIKVAYLDDLFLGGGGHH